MTLAFEDLRAGRSYDLGTVLAEEREMIDFARRYDPQPFHVDPAAAAASPFRGLAASGWYTISLFMRAYVDGLLADSTSQGSPGGDEFRWFSPVRPGEVLSARVTVLDTAPSRTRPDRGTAVIRGELLRDGEAVMTIRFRGLFGRRNPPD